MYVDDSGTPRLDDTPFYVITGVIININDLFTIEKKLELFQKNISILNIKRKRFMSMRYTIVEANFQGTYVTR